MAISAPHPEHPAPARTPSKAFPFQVIAATHCLLTPGGIDAQGDQAELLRAVTVRRVSSSAMVGGTLSVNIHIQLDRSVQGGALHAETISDGHQTTFFLDVPGHQDENGQPTRRGVTAVTLDTTHPHLGVTVQVTPFVVLAHLTPYLSLPETTITLLPERIPGRSAQEGALAEETLILRVGQVTVIPTDGGHHLLRFHGGRWTSEWLQASADQDSTGDAGAFNADDYATPVQTFVPDARQVGTVLSRDEAKAICAHKLKLHGHAREPSGAERRLALHLRSAR